MELKIDSPYSTGGAVEHWIKAFGDDIIKPIASAISWSAFWIAIAIAYAGGK